MPYSQSKKLTATEKRLQALKAQLYGKGAQNNTSLYRAAAVTIDRAAVPSYPARAIDNSSAQTLIYLRQDLLRIAALAVLAVTSEIVLFFAFNNQTLTNLFK